MPTTVGEHLVKPMERTQPVSLEWREAVPATLAPVLLATANVVAVYAESAGHWSVALRAIGASMALGMAVGLACLAALRRPGPATAASCFIILVVVGYPAGGVALGGWAAFAYWQHIHHRPSPAFPEWNTTQFAAALLVVTIAFAAIGGAFRPGDFTFGGPRPVKASGEDGRNIYLVMLDAYPRADTLLKVFGYDNSGFIDRLRALRFTVYANAMSPTTRSERTLLSLLSRPSDTPLTEPDGWFESADSPRRDTRRALATADAGDQLREAGYRLVYIPSQIKHTDIGGWDFTLDSGHLNDLEVSLLERSQVLAPILGEWVLDQQRGRVEATFASLTEQAKNQGKKVVLAHVLAPHAPLIFGTGAEVPDCWVRGCTLWGYHRVDEPGFASDYLANLQELNRRLIAALESVLAYDPDATVVVFSDHGIREGQGQDEWQRSFLAARGTTVLDHEPTVAHLLYRLAPSIESVQ